MLVVEQLEPVDVDHQDADRVTRPPALGEQADELVEVTPVRESGQRVRGCARLGVAVRVHPGERGRRLDRRATEDPPRRLRPGRPDPARHDERPDDPIGRRQRHRQHLAQPVHVLHPPGDPVGGLGRRGRPPMDRVAQVAQRQRRGMVGHARSEAHEMGAEPAAVLVPAHDHDVVRAGRCAELPGDGIDDGVGRHRPRQAAQDPGERFGLTTPAGVESRDRLAVDEGREPRDEDHPEEDPVGEARVGRDRAQQRDDADDDEGEGERPPGPADPAIHRVHGSRGARCGSSHVGNTGWGAEVAASTRWRSTDGRIGLVLPFGEGPTPRRRRDRPPRRSPPRGNGRPARRGRVRHRA